MLRKFLNQIVEALPAQQADESNNDDRHTAIRNATAVLMLDVALADKVFDDSELARVLELVQSHFGISADEADDLARVAEKMAADLTSLHDFTQVLHENLSDDEKTSIIELLWEVAFADGRLDKYEDSLILKIGDLLYINRFRVMRAKHDAERSAAERA